ncbi:MAG: hypothetical protein ACI9Y1_001427 [Lentisphaeria bacterium]|jgi:hypothetical protein
MFAILLTDKTDGFYSIVLTFPTVIFSFLLIVSLIYWLISFLGVIDLDMLDADVDGAMGGDDVGMPSSVAGLAMRLGLNGVPLPIIISLIAIFSWSISYYSVHFMYPFVPGFLEWLAGIVILFGSLYLAILITAQIIKPIRRLFKQADQQVEKHIVGRIGVVRTGRVDKCFGEAVVEDGGAGLVVKVRSFKDEEFSRGDRIVLLEYVASGNIYKVISEKDFNK